MLVVIVNTKSRGYLDYVSLALHIRLSVGREAIQLKARLTEGNKSVSAGNLLNLGLLSSIAI